jgi:ABC-type multidrug transport system ATPase subunit
MHKGIMLGLHGHNGAGKSTTMAIFTGLYAPPKGDVRVNGVSVKRDSRGVHK